MRIRKILFATDFSTPSVRAFQAAMDLAKQNKAQLAIFHALIPAVIYDEGETTYPALYSQIEVESKKQAEAGLARLKARAEKAKIKTVAQMRKGPAADQILKAAKSQRADLIVVGTHGRTGLSKLLLGSVASRVISMADRPVLTVPGR